MSRPLAALLACWAFALVPSEALAGEPTVAACLSASDASIKLDNDHKLRAERAQLLVCASASCPSEIRLECTRRAEDLRVQLPTLVLVAKDRAGADLVDVKVTMDGEVLTTRLDGNPVTLDPGPHAFGFEAPGRPRVEQTLLVRQAEKNRRESVLFEALPPEPQPAPAPPPLLTRQRKLALAAGGVGVVGLAVGIGFAASAMSQKSAAEQVCPNDRCPTSDGVSKWSSAVTSGNVATVGFVFGGIGLAAGAVLWFTARARPTSTTEVGLGLHGLEVRGAF